jgi:RimJ/RimL family protein N-acetyltransferase
MTFDSSAHIQTERLTLRAPQVSDAPRIADMANDIKVARMLAPLPHPYAVEDAESFLLRMEAADRAREPLFIIDHRQAGTVGVIGFSETDDLGPEVGYWIGRDYWGQGLATEATNAAMAWARDAWGRRVVVSGHFEDNPASGRVLIKAGFLYTGRIEARRSIARDAEVPTRMMVWLA